jgi:uncharacterized protein GlcG (DUF336 family)
MSRLYCLIRNRQLMQNKIAKIALANVVVGAVLGMCTLPALSASSTTAAAAATPAPTPAPAATFTVIQISLEAAQMAAQAALVSCRAAGFQVAVAVVDRSGSAVVTLRDRFAGAHTHDMALNKAWTAASFKISTTALAAETQAGKPMSGIRNLPRVAAVGGGMPINASGSLVGAIGVSGAPGGDADDVCAKAGIAAIADELAF